MARLREVLGGAEDVVGIDFLAEGGGGCSCFGLFLVIVTLDKELQEQLGKAQSNVEEIEKLSSKLKTEQLLKQQAVNKLAEIMNRKDLSSSGKNKNKASAADLRKKEKDCRRLQQELTQEREKYGQLAAKWQKDLQDLQVSDILLFVLSL